MCDSETRMSEMEMARRMDGWMDGWMEGGRWMDGWMDG